MQNHRKFRKGYGLFAKCFVRGALSALDYYTVHLLMKYEVNDWTVVTLCVDNIKQDEWLNVGFQ